MPKIRISAINFKISPVGSFDDFADHVIRLVDQVTIEKPDFIIFPELFTIELMHLFDDVKEISEKFIRLTCFTDDFLNLFKNLARENTCYIVGGSHLKAVEGKYLNTSHLFTPEGRIFEQSKCHLIPIEKAWTTPGSSVSVFETDKAKISILICYDMEFPETARLAALQGAEILISPSATLDRSGFWRVRHCAQARCIEDQAYAVHCCLLGGTSDIFFWGRSSILTPCDMGFPEKGIAKESKTNKEMVITAELDTELLHEIRAQGAVRPLDDLRSDMIEKVHQISRARDRKNR